MDVTKPHKFIGFGARFEVSRRRSETLKLHGSSAETSDGVASPAKSPEASWRLTKVPSKASISYSYHQTL